MMIVKTKSEHMAFLAGRQSGLCASTDAYDQLVEQIIVAREELQRARTEHKDKIAAARAHFDSEAAAMRKELTAALAELDGLRLLMFNKWQRHPADAMH